MTETALDRLERVLDAALEHDRNLVDAPVALLWADKDRQWQSILPELRRRRPLISYGAYAPQDAQGPAYWLRCVIAGTIDLPLSPGGVPIVYLPGLSRDDFRTIGASSPELAPLVALQHRSQWFGNRNGKDWTIRALLINKDRGLGLNVAGDDETAAALVASLPRLLEQPMSRLVTRYVDAGRLNGLLNPDPVRTLLDWIDDPPRTRSACDDSTWSAFVHHCGTELDLDLTAATPIDAARRLGEAEGPWTQVWQRFRASPSDHPQIPQRLRTAQAELMPKHPEGWPTLAEEAEEQLRTDLLALGDQAPAAACARVRELEEQHRARRGHVWADLGLTPLALALEHLAEVARIAVAPPAGSSVATIAAWYAETGWRVDRAVLVALGEVDRPPQVAAVSAALRAIYRPWLDLAARHLQAAVGSAANGGAYTASPPLRPQAGEVVAFVDGLRLDVAHLLEERLQDGHQQTQLTTALAALPTVTQTAKPALAPIDRGLLEAGSGLDARRAPNGPPAGARVLRTLMADAGVEILGPSDVGDPSGAAWTEMGDVDRRGHEMGIRLAHEIDELVDRIARRIRELLDAGWEQVTVVTDHGWLLLPGGLPKNEDLPATVTEVKKGRCARIKEGAHVGVPTVAWHWSADVRIAVAPGIECFEANQAYEHGGISPQECVVPRLQVTRAEVSSVPAAEIVKARWRGLTFVVEFTDLPDGATIDLRTRAADAGSSVAQLAQVTGGAGKAILLVEDEDLEGQPVQLVVVAADDTVLLQRQTTIGWNR